MPTDDEDNEGAVSTPDRTPLSRIAAALGCSVEDLKSNSRDPLDVKGASELLTIWAEMDSDADRERLLAFARKLTEPR